MTSRLELVACLRLIIPTPISMATLFPKGQIVIGQVGKYKVVKHLQNTVWLARYWLLYVFMTRRHSSHRTPY